MNENTIEHLQKLESKIKRIKKKHYKNQEFFEKLEKDPVVIEYLESKKERDLFLQNHIQELEENKKAQQKLIKENCTHPLYALVDKDGYGDSPEGSKTEFRYLCVECDASPYYADYKCLQWKPKHVIDLTKLELGLHGRSVLFNNIHQEYLELSKKYEEESVVSYLERKYGEEFLATQDRIKKIGEEDTQKGFQLQKRVKKNENLF
ncbi:MAG: hypothetical protein PHN72_02790 [Bacilli bacterium]|nr:hypothetical protein [Bacilli bacterium]